VSEGRGILLNTYIIRKGIRGKGKGFGKSEKTLENVFDDLI
jgi:hypothetical protein